MRLAEMTWREAERARDRGAVVLFPMGSTEEHGPHSPMGDYLAADAIAVQAASETGDVVAPTLPFSYSEYFRDFPGTLSLEAATLSALVRDVVTCLVDQGFERVVLVNGHKGNQPTLLQLARTLRRERHLLLPIVSPLGMALTRDVHRELYGDEPVGHGAEPMGSLMKHLFPTLARPDAAEDFGVRDFQGMPIGSLSGLDFDGSEVLLPLNMADVAPPSGSMADPRRASDERGRRIAEASIDKLVRFIQWWKSVDPRAAPVPTGPQPHG